MFVSDKDLKKVPNNKRPATTASSAVINSKHNVPVKQQPNTIISSNSVSATSNTIDVVERTRIEREQRQLLRDQLVYVVKIQAYCRGHKVRSNLLKNLRLELDKKLQDIEKVAVAVKAQADIEFSPPSNITMGLLPQLLFLKHRSSDDVTRFLRFLKLMINPSLSQADPTKNLICELTFPSNMQVMNQLNDLSLGSLLIATTSKRDASFSEPALIFLGLLCGLNTNKLNNALDGHFQVARSHVLINGFLTKIRNLLTCSGESLMKVTVNEDILSKSPDFNRIQLTHCSHIVSRCVRICMKLTESCSNNELNGRLADFTREILCVPHLTCLITPATTTKLASWPLLGSLLLQLKDKINSNTLALPPLKHDVIQSGQVLFGNIASLAPKLPILPTRASIHPERSASGSTTGNVFDSMNGQDGEYIHYNDTVVQAYISTTTALIVRYPVAGVFEGKSGVMWVKNETSMIASAIPVSLHAQVLCLLHPEYLRALYSRILLPIRTDLNTYALEADIADIHLAKTKTGLQLAQDIIKHEQEASVWFTSKWASKLVSNVTKTIGLKSSGIIDSKGSISASASIGKNNEEDSGYSAVKGEAEDSTIVLTDSEFTLNPALVACLVSQWALLLSQSVGAPIHSAPFRALSTLAYATNSLDRLWAALITLPISQISATVKDSLFSQVSSSRNFAQPLSGKHVSSVEKSTTSSSSSSSSFLSIFTSPWTNKPSSSSSSTSAMPVSISNTNTASSGNKKVSAVLFDNQNKSSIDVDNQRTLESLVSNMDFYVQFIPEGPLAFIVVISCLMRTHLIALDDSEFYTQEKPLPQAQLLRLVRILKLLLYGALRSDPSRVMEAPPASLSSNNVKWNSVGYLLPQFQYAALRTVSVVLSDLYSRWARKPFCSVSLWQIDQADNVASLKAHWRVKSPFTLALFRIMPWVVTFHDRMKLVRELLDDEKLEIQGAAFDTLNPFAQPQRPRSRGTQVSVHRARIIEDGIKGFEKVGINIKDRIVVRYVNDFGEEEKGIDSGGLFKDFLTDLSSRVFNPSYGLFSMTQSRALYPNPGAIALYGEHETERLYSFLGRILGKAIFENITVQPEFTHFFLSFLHGRYNYLQLVNDLASLDPEIHKNLMFLKTYEGDIADLCLTFSITDENLGVHKEIELFPGGSRVPVTSENKLRYINSAAKYYLHDRLKLQASAFFNGVRSVVNPEYLGIFCGPELQVIISGASTGVLLSDMKAHTQYGGGYSSMSEIVKRFWITMEEFSDQDRAALLKFVTSCERPPSLGFAALEPPFTIQRVECSDDSRLPTASTCFNILKLPTYSSQSVLKAKLLTAIRSGAGFDLS